MGRPTRRRSIKWGDFATEKPSELQVPSPGRMPAKDRLTAGWHTEGMCALADFITHPPDFGAKGVSMLTSSTVYCRAARG